MYTCLLVAGTFESLYVRYVAMTVTYILRPAVAVCGEQLPVSPVLSHVAVSCTQAPAPPEGSQNNLASLYTQNQGHRPARKNYRNIPQAPDRILDAPELLDDYYLNLLDWGPNNVVSETFVLSHH
jgi:hypothetical protein